jgi:hypothetical protein
MYRITYWSNNLAISIAGIIGAFFFSDYLFELFIAVAAMSLLSLMVTWIFLRKPYRQRQAINLAIRETYGQERKHRFGAATKRCFMIKRL